MTHEMKTMREREREEKRQRLHESPRLVVIMVKDADDDANDDDTLSKEKRKTESKFAQKSTVNDPKHTVAAVAADKRRGMNFLLDLFYSHSAFTSYRRSFPLFSMVFPLWLIFSCI